MIYNLSISSMTLPSVLRNVIRSFIPVFLLLFSLFITGKTARAAIPNAPTSVTATAQWRKASLSWTASSTLDVIDYTVYRATGGGTYTQVAANVTTTTYTNTGLTDGATYSYKVRANNSTGESADSNIASVTMIADAVAPNGTIQSPANGTRLSVHSIGSISGTVFDELGGSDVNLVNLRLYRLPAWPAQNYEYWNGSQWTGPSVATLATTLTRDTSITTSQAYDWVSNATLPSGTDLPSGWYSVAIVAYDTKGNGRTISANFMVGTDVTAPQLAITIPAAPSGAGPLDFIELTSLPEISGTCVDPAGSPGDEVTGMYRAQVNLTRIVGSVTEYWNGTAWSATATSLLQILAPNATTWSMTTNLPSGSNLPPGDYKIVAKGVDRTFLNGAGTTRNIRIVVPGAPTGLTAVGRDGNVELSWTGNSFASGYNVKRSLSTGTGFTTIAFNVTAATYVDTARTNGTTYYYKVSSVAPSGESADSNEASATPILDVTKPVVTITTPANGTRFLAHSLGTISGKVTDELSGSGVQKVVLRISRNLAGTTQYWSGTAWLTSITNLTTTLTVDSSVTTAVGYSWTSNASLPSGTDLPSMTYLILAIGYDNRNNTFQPSVRIYVGSDVTIPVVSITSPTANTNPAIPVEMTSLTQMSGTCSDPSGAPGDDVSGVNYVQAYVSKLDGGTRKYWDVPTRTWVVAGSALTTVLSQNNTVWTATTGFPTLAEMPPGEYQIQARAVDMTNNVSVRPVVNISIMFPAPTNLVAIGARGGVHLSWNAVPHSVRYKVWRSSSSGGIYTEIATDIMGTSYEDADVGHDETYYYKVLAYTDTEGPFSNIASAHTPAHAWGAGSAIACGGIRWPVATATIYQGSEGNVSAYLATDVDVRGLFTDDVLVSSSNYSDTCSYTWTTTGGSFKNGVNTGQGVIWIAPTTPGTYTLTLTVDDLNAANQPWFEGGARDDAARGYDDPALTFTVDVTVLPTP